MKYLINEKLNKKWVIVTEKFINVESNDVSIYCPCYLGARNTLGCYSMLFGDFHDLRFAIDTAKIRNYPKFLFDSKEEAEEYIRSGKILGYDEKNARTAMYFV